MTGEGAGQATRPAAAPPRPRWVVLLVDDEPDILGSVKMLLERSPAGVRVVTAASGDEALGVLARERVDLVISDFKMPGMDGIELLARARKSWPEAPRILFTAYADAELERRATAEADLSAFLPKTLGSGELVRAVEALLAKRPPRPPRPPEARPA